MQTTTERPGLQALNAELAALDVAQMHARAAIQSCKNTPYVLGDEDVPHLELIDRAMASLQCARDALDLHRPLWGKADGFIEEAGRLVRELEELPSRGAA